MGNFWRKFLKVGWVECVREFGFTLRISWLPKDFGLYILWTPLYCHLEWRGPWSFESHGLICLECKHPHPCVIAPEQHKRGASTSWANKSLPPQQNSFGLHWCNVQRYVGVIWFFFHVLHFFYYLDLHNKTCVALANLSWNTSKIGNWKSEFLNSVLVVESACLLTF